MPFPGRARRGRGIIILALLALVAVAIPTGVLARKPPPAPVTIQLLNTSDWHGQIDPSFNVGGAWSIAARWQEDRLAYPSLTVTGGDDFGASPPLASFFDEVPAVLSERMMGVDVSALGNHNFDRGLAHLQQMLDLAGARPDADHPGSPFRYVSANLRHLKANLDDVDPVAYFKVGGTKVAVIGITNEEAPGLVSPGNFGTIEVTDGVAAANKFAKKARKAGADVVVIVTHKGVRGFDGSGAAFGELVDFAQAVNGADVILGDHTDVQFSGTINGALVTETRSKGGSYAKVLLTVQPGKDGNVIDKAVTFVTPTAPARTSSQLVAATCPDPAGALPAKYCDAAILAMLSPYRLNLASFLDVKVATATATFVRGGNIERRQEVAQGDLIADGMRWFQGTDFALMNGGGIRSALPSSYVPLDGSLVRPPAVAPWDLVLGDIYSTLPFGNTVLKRTVTGTQLWAALENGVSQISATDGTGGDGRFPQISGFKVAFDYSRATGCSGSGAAYVCTPSRVYSVTWPDGTPIAPDGTVYTLATINFINQGGDAYRMLLDGQTGTNEVLDATVLNAYFNFLGPIPILTPTTDGRIAKCSGCAP
ncbi:MAG: 5'-nucleotidase C-terminal domain-containing protein [Chloroflexota bacterium]